MKRVVLGKKLSFTLNIDNVQTIGQHRMVDTNVAGNNNNDTAEETGFLIDLRKNHKGIHLIGKKGTLWKKLQFDCPTKTCHQYINQNGMVEKE